MGAQQAATRPHGAGRQRNLAWDPRIEEVLVSRFFKEEEVGFEISLKDIGKGDLLEQT